MPIGSPRSMSRYSSHTIQLEPIREKDPETKLWQAVLGQAFFDAFGPDRYEVSKREKHEALDFLKNTDSEEFKILCENAGFDPGYIKRKARKKFAEKFISAISNLSTKVRNINETKQNA